MRAGSAVAWPRGAPAFDRERVEGAARRAERLEAADGSRALAASSTIVRDAGLPQPQANSLLTARDHPRLEVDLHWPAHRLIVELDGYETHRTRAAFEADRQRDAALTADGYRVVRFTWRTPDAVMRDRLRALLTAAGTRPRRGSPAR